MIRTHLSVTLSILFVVSLGGCGSDESSSEVGGSGNLTPAELAKLQPQVMTFCGGCHDPPRPDSFPRDAWHSEIELAYRLFAASDRRDLTPPPVSDVVAWYRSQAPTELSLRQETESPSPVSFQHQEAGLDATLSSTMHTDFPGVSHIFVPDPDIAGDLSSTLFCDMSRNGVFTLRKQDAVPTVGSFIEARHPAHIEQTDLNVDGVPDYLLCELGSFLPEDHDRGRLVWVTFSQDGSPATHTLLDSVGRIVDARPGDFDQDGDLDVIVAVFGWRSTGQLLMLEQTNASDGVPQFRIHQLDDRHGAIHVPVVDLDNDGDLDFVVLFSQEYETVEAFVNRGDATFERQIIYLTGSPSYGSSGIELTDLDNDGDTDILYTNGDTLDSSLLKPYHSVQWLENEGDFPFARHQIGAIPGAFRAVASDIDIDGDLDVVASAWIPANAEPPSPRSDETYVTLAWYEQTASGRFACHPLKSGVRDGYLTLAVSDLNDDGRSDIIAGHFSSAKNQGTAWIDIFWNRGGR